MRLLAPPFFFSVLYFLCLPIFLPSLRLGFFIPFLVFAYYRTNFVASLALSLCCGFFLDLFSSYTRLGFHALNYCLTTFFLWDRHYHFFEDSISTLPAMTFLFAVISTLLDAVLCLFLDHNLLPSWKWLGTDLLLFPFLDGLYALVCFTFPLKCLAKKTRRI